MAERPKKRPAPRSDRPAAAAAPPMYVIYARKSPGETKGLSIPTQIEWGAAEGERRGMRPAQDVGIWFKNGVETPWVGGAYVDEGAHGSRLTVRGGLWRMLQDAKDGRFSAIIVYRGDRLSRSAVAKPLIVSALSQFGVPVYAGDNPAGDPLVSDLTGVLAQSEVAILRQRTKDSLARTRKEKLLGRRVLGFVNVGLRRVPTPEAEALHSAAMSGTDLATLLASPEAAALKIRSDPAMKRLLANMRAHAEGRLEERLAAARGGQAERLRRMDERDRLEETELAHRLIDLNPDIRKVL